MQIKQGNLAGDLAGAEKPSHLGRRDCVCNRGREWVESPSVRVQPGMLTPQLGSWGPAPAFSGQGPHALPQPDPQLSSLCLGGFLSHQTMCELKSAPLFGLRPWVGHMRST